MKRIAFDLDGVIGTIVAGNDKPEVRYPQAKPIESMIKIVNSLHDKGNYIIVYTARGMNTYNGDVSLVNEKLFELTKNQLESWGVKYHELILGKIHYDVLIDDKAINSINVGSYEGVAAFVNAK